MTENSGLFTLDGAQAYLAPVEVLYKYQTFQPIVMRSYGGVDPR